MKQLSKADIIEMITNNPKGYASVLKNRYSYVIKLIKENYSKYTSENLYKWLYDISSTPKCICGEPLKFCNIKRGYLLYCSVRCINYLEKNKKTKESNLVKYGVDNPMKLPEFKERAKNTCLDRYGHNSPMQSIIIRNKHKNNFRDNYGVDNPMKLPEFKERAKNTCLDRYGVNNPSKCKKIQNKQLDAFKQTIYNRFNNTFESVSPLFTVEEYQWTKNKSYKWLCNICNNSFLDYVYNGHTPACPKCNIKTKSLPQIEIGNFLKETLKLEIKFNDRSIIKPYELDIVILDKKVAIEYCGLYWHGEKSGTLKKYHYNKLNMANAAGWRLITIFEDEWINKTDICKNRLTYILNEEKVEHKIYARQCQITEISSTTFNNFLKKVHIQGPITNVSVKLGAFYNTKLVSVMGFSKLRKALGSTATKNAYELIRFASNQNIPGIGSKLFSKFIHKYNPKVVISYCDLRWGTGNFYDRLGFTFDSVTSPNYWYFKAGSIVREHRFKYTKKNIVKKFNEDFNKTEWRIMQEHGYDRIWDCGNLKYIWRSK